MNSKKVVVSLTLAIGIVSFVSPVNQPVFAETESQIEATRSALQSELAEKREELENIQTELVTLREEIDRVNEAIEANEEKIAETEELVEEKQAEIEALEEEIVLLEEDIQRRYEILKDRASALQKSGGVLSYLDVLLGAQNFTDFIDRVSVVTRITQADQGLIEQLEKDQAIVEEQKTLVEEKLTELEETKVELEMMQQQILEQKEEHEAKQERLKEQEEESQAIIKDLEIEDSELERMLENARAEAARQRDEATAQVSGGQVSQFSSSSDAPTVSAGSGSMSDIISAGYKYIGNSAYKFGGGRNQDDISRGLFDCSGFVAWAFRQGGVSLPASTSSMSSVGTKVSTSEMKPGDLVFFDTYKVNGHVGIYLGNNQFIGSQSSTGVAIESMASGYWANTFKGHVRRVN